MTFWKEKLTAEEIDSLSRDSCSFKVTDKGHKTKAQQNEVKSKDDITVTILPKNPGQQL